MTSAVLYTKTPTIPHRSTNSLTGATRITLLLVIELAA